MIVAVVIEVVLVGIAAYGIWRGRRAVAAPVEPLQAG
jgi:hypothetical protein